MTGGGEKKFYASAGAGDVRKNLRNHPALKGKQNCRRSSRTGLAITGGNL